MFGEFSRENLTNCSPWNSFQFPNLRRSSTLLLLASLKLVSAKEFAVAQGTGVALGVYRKWMLMVRERPLH